MATNTRTRRPNQRQATNSQHLVRRNVVNGAPVNQQINTKESIRDQFNTVLGNELAALLWYMTRTGADEVSFGWTIKERHHAYRYMRVLTHGDEANQDYSSLTEEQIGAIRLIFQVLCAFEDSRMLTRTWLDSMREKQEQAIILPGMETDWYTDGYDRILEWIEVCEADIRNIRDASRVLADWRSVAFLKSTPVDIEKAKAELVMTDA